MASSLVNTSNFPLNDSFCSIHHPSLATRVVLSVFYMVLLVIGAFGNILAIYITSQKKKMNSTDLYLINLAVSDVLFTLALPGRITYYVLDFNWPFSDWFCRVTAFMFYMNTYGSVYLMTCISIDRYIAVVHANQSHKFRCAGWAKYICVVVWGLASLQTIPLLFLPLTKKIGVKLSCMEYTSVERILSLPLLLLGGCALGFFGPVGIILFCYVKITLKLCRIAQENSVRSKNGHHKKACLVILLVLMAVIICFSPYHFNIIRFVIKGLLYQSTCTEQKAFKVSLQVTVCFMNMNCCIDPIIYFFASQGYKKQFLRIFKPRISASFSSTGKTSSETNSNNQEGDSVLA
ncbi:G-protein coupled receptor 183-like [Phascolarctos cinereus]|uniref:G-protein coupled receptor 183-like n=1 Tax=Phascolarctos cinereus TaxID=38626 RepID=A0A6P5IM04_PHACI|nr:G-protein coupled receptor 183-like [Phascolarctos cinereus]